MYTTADFKGNCFRIHMNYARHGHNSILLFSVKYILHFVFYHSTMFLKGPCQPIKTLYMLTVTYQHTNDSDDYWLLLWLSSPLTLSATGGRGGRILPITQKFHNSSNSEEFETLSLLDLLPFLILPWKCCQHFQSYCNFSVNFFYL